MSSSFTVRSAGGVIVSLLNPVDISPMDSVRRDCSSSDVSSDSEHAKKKHVCSECDRSFSTMGHLNRHLTMHTGDKEHVCPFPECGKKASRRDNLVQHYRMHLPRGEHNRCTTYIRSRMEQRMMEAGVSPVRKPRGRRDTRIPRPAFGGRLLSPVLTAHRVTPPSRRSSVSSESSMSWSPASTPAPFERPMTGSSDSTSRLSCSPSPPLLTPPLPVYAEHDHYFAFHHGAPVYQPSAGVSDYTRKLPVSNAREE